MTNHKSEDYKTKCDDASYRLQMSNTFIWID